jgi:hypothetical protein
MVAAQVRFRCLAFLEQQVEELERAEQDRMEERQVGAMETRQYWDGVLLDRTTYM